MVNRTIVVAWLALALPLSEPAARKPVQIPVKVTARLAHVSAARELADGRVLITDAKTPALLILDPRTGATSPLGSLGPGPNQYVTPGGLYGGPDGTTLLLDRGQTRTMTISATGEFKGTKSIAEHGKSGSSDEDIDQQRIDARGFAYFLDNPFGRKLAGTDKREASIVRFEPVTQRKETVATVQLPEMRTITDGPMTFGRVVVGSPADGWGVAPDGRVAVVRAAPYRVEWYGTDGKVAGGPPVPFDPLPITEADKQAHAAARRGAGGSVSASSSSGATMDANKIPTEFAATKPPFTPADVIVSPDSRVWVMRTRPLATQEILYDVFDRAGRRIDRIELPAGSRIVGFGPSSIYVRHNDGAAGCELRKYIVK